MSDRDLTLALLEALRVRARTRNTLRDEIRADSKKGARKEYALLPGWMPAQRAEIALGEALRVWEESEGIIDK